MIAIANDDNSNSHLDHLLKYVQPDSSLEWTEVWQKFHDNRWFKKRLNDSAGRVISQTGLPQEWKEDVKQEALIVFSRALQRDKTLGFDERRGNFGSFISTIIYRCCQKGLRQFRRSINQAVTADKHPLTEPMEALDDRLDLRDCVWRLDEPYQSTVRLILFGRSITEIARLTKRSERTIYRRLERAIELLRELLDPL